MPKSPLNNLSPVVECALYCDGNALPSTTTILSADVEYRINCIPKATIVLADGNVATGKFELCEDDQLKPGKEISLKAGYATKLESIFTGTIVRLGISTLSDGRSCTKIECRHKAIALTKSRKNANYQDKSDDDIISSIASKYNVEIDSSIGGAPHKGLLQYYCTDWDFIMTRAEANGCWLLADNKGLSIKPIATGRDAEISLTWGTDIIDFNATIDAENQIKKVESCSWDVTKQEVISGNSDAQSIQTQGNSSADDLQKVLSIPNAKLQINSQVDKDVLDTWARAEQCKNELSRIYGNVTFIGNSNVNLGEMVQMDYVSARFNGKALISGIHHHMEPSLWKTTLSFGMKKEWYYEKFNTTAPAASGYNCGITGLLIGVVIQIHEDPENLNRVKVKIPLMQNEQEGVWARLGTPYASNGVGGLFYPEVNDEVVLGFFNGDPSSPVILGSLYSSKNQVPQKLEQKNDIKQLLTREKLSVLFDEKDKIITVMTPGERKITLDDKGKKISLEDSKGNKVELSDSGIKLDSPKDIVVSTKGKFNVDAKGGIILKSATDLKGEGLNVEFKAKVGLKAQGTATAELSASGQTVVKGAMVMIN
ncbi:MAG: type VI secretion system tip protein VgrG [Fibrobacter sp.]|nr:type VI secretion system tip protein VgrG [Fibrobacter sp.]